MKILGLDPALAKTGFAVIEGEKALDHGLINTGSSDVPVGDRLDFLRMAIQNIVSMHSPDVLILEDFWSVINNRVTHRKLQWAVGAIVIACRPMTPIFYNPSQWKKTVTNDGKATKDAVRKVVATRFGLKPKSLSFDEADALAVALCHYERCKP